MTSNQLSDKSFKLSILYQREVIDTPDAELEVAIAHHPKAGSILFAPFRRKKD